MNYKCVPFIYKHWPLTFARDLEKWSKKFAGTDFENCSSGQTFWYIAFLINKKWPRDYISNSTIYLLMLRKQTHTYIRMLQVHKNENNVINLYSFTNFILNIKSHKTNLKIKSTTSKCKEALSVISIMWLRFLLFVVLIILCVMVLFKIYVMIRYLWSIYERGAPFFIAN